MGVVVLCPAQETAPADVQGRIFAKALDYDRHLLRKDPDTVHIAFLEGKDHEVVKGLFDALAQAGATLGTKPVTTCSTVYTDTTTLAGWLAEQKAVALYIPADMEAPLADILAACHDAQVCSLAGSVTYVDQGASFAVAVENGKPKILINLLAAREEGADFTAQFLRLATIVKK